MTKLCINCAHHYIPPGLRQADYNAHMCAKGAQRSLVTGAPISVLENCSTRRADSGDCKPEALLYAPELTAADLSISDFEKRQMSNVMAKINSQMHSGTCPTSGSVGECAAIDKDSNGLYWAALYIWDNEFNDSSMVANWFHSAGADEVLISHVLHDEANGDRCGRTFDGVRAWHVQFSMPNNPS